MRAKLLCLLVVTLLVIASVPLQAIGLFGSTSETHEPEGTIAPEHGRTAEEVVISLWPHTTIPFHGKIVALLGVSDGYSPPVYIRQVTSDTDAFCRFSIHSEDYWRVMGENRPSISWVEPPAIAAKRKQFASGVMYGESNPPPPKSEKRAQPGPQKFNRPVPGYTPGYTIMIRIGMLGDTPRIGDTWRMIVIDPIVGVNPFTVFDENGQPATDIGGFAEGYGQSVSTEGQVQDTRPTAAQTEPCVTCGIPVKDMQPSSAPAGIPAVQVAVPKQQPVEEVVGNPPAAPEYFVPASKPVTPQVEAPVAVAPPVAPIAPVAATPSVWDAPTSQPATQAVTPPVSNYHADQPGVIVRFVDNNGRPVENVRFVLQSLPSVANAWEQRPQVTRTGTWYELYTFPSGCGLIYVNIASADGRFASVPGIIDPNSNTFDVTITLGGDNR